jgi:hypothetical protein
MASACAAAPSGSRCLVWIRGTAGGADGRLAGPGLARVAEDTGGGYIEIRFGQDLGAAFAQVADELHSQYLLGFAPPKRDGKVHEIEVRTPVKGLKPRARKSYVAPKEARS